MKSILIASFLVGAVSFPAFAGGEQGAGTAPSKVDFYQSVRLNEGTRIELMMAQTVTTRDRHWDDGDVFDLVVSESIRFGEFIVIPEGTLARGHVRRSSGRGIFGRSGKIEVEVDYLLLGGTPLRLTGAYRAEGRGELTSVGSVAAAGFLAIFIAGDDGEIVRGSHITAYLAEDLHIMIPDRQPIVAAAQTSPTTVRARRIAVSEVFGQAEQLSMSDRQNTSALTTTSFEETFKDELDSIDQ